MRVSFRDLSRLSGIHPGVIRFRAVERGCFRPDDVDRVSRPDATIEESAGWELVNSILSDSEFRRAAQRAVANKIKGD